MKVNTLTRIKTFTLLSLLLLSTTLTISFFPLVKAETKIISINPISGNVGANVTLAANVSNLGLYRILFDENEILSENATEHNITTSLIIPPAPQGAHNVTIIDAAGENGTTSFTIMPSQLFTPQVPAYPTQIQEGASVTITVNITGSLAHYTYPKLKVQTPRVDLNYTTLDNFNITTDAYGACLINVTYPDNFSTGANTNFTGYYKLFFNETVVGQFFVGLTNASAYHRGDVVNIKAVNYPVNENATITVTFGNTTIHTYTYNATDGTVNYDWTVPNNSLLSNSTHTYNVTITPVPSAKNFSDTQAFEIPGFNVTIYTQNLAGKTVSNVLVKLYDESASTYYTSSSGINGYAFFKLEKGNYAAEAYFKEVRVGDGLQFNVTGETSLNVSCQLTSLIIIVESEGGVHIPNVTINVAYNYTTNYGTTKNETGEESGQTDIDGTLLFSAMLPNVTYLVNASLYGAVFNVGNNTIADLPVADYVNATILCPTRRLNIQVFDAKDQRVPSATVRAQELTVGLFVEGTLVNGNVTLNCTFGKYSVSVFFGEILLNETVFDLTLNDIDVNVTIKCQLYDLDVAVKVVDYFGQPISGANVKLQRDTLHWSNQTDSNGIATFSNVVGGGIWMTVYLPGQSDSYVNTTAYVGNSGTLTVRILRYVALAGFLVEASQLVTSIIIVLTALFIIFIEVYRRRHFKREEVQKLSQNKEQ